MITIYKKNNVMTNNNEQEIEMRGLSTDTKPTSIVVDGENTPISNGTIFVEIDTGKMFLYDLSTETWNEV